MGQSYKYEFKIKIVREYNQGYSPQYLANKYHVAVGTIRNWCSQHEMYGREGLEKSMSKTKYSGEFKRSVLKYRQINQTSYKETAQRFGIKNISTIANWQRAFDTKGFPGLESPKGRPKTKGDSIMAKKEDSSRKLTPSELEELIELREKNQYLEAELAYLKKLDALIQKKSRTKRKPKSS